MAIVLGDEIVGAALLSLALALSLPQPCLRLKLCRGLCSKLLRFHIGSRVGILDAATQGRHFPRTLLLPAARRGYQALLQAATEGHREADDTDPTQNTSEPHPGAAAGPWPPRARAGRDACGATEQRTLDRACP